MTTARNTIADTYHDEAITSGLRHVDGWGSRSVFEGDAAAWGAFATRLRGTVAIARGVSLRSAKAALGRAEHAILVALTDEAARAFDAGGAAFGTYVAPAQDPAMMAILDTVPEGCAAVILADWIRGFDLATKAASDDVAAKAVRS